MKTREIIRLFVGKALPLLLVVLMFASCRSGQNITYIIDAQRDSAQTIIQSYTSSIMPGDKTIIQSYTSSIMPGDRLYIYVEGINPQSVVPFNQETHRISVAANRVMNVSNEDGVVSELGEDAARVQYLQSDISGYLVNEEGCIYFPVLGKMDVEGMTMDSLGSYLEYRLENEGYVKSPNVTVNLMNFRVTVIGEVRNPRQVHVDGTRLTILEALAISGDITDYGMRNNVIVMRTNNGREEIGEIDLTSASMLESPYYYLHQNDIVYVEPNYKKKRHADEDPNVMSYISMGISISRLILINNYRIRRYSN